MEFGFAKDSKDPNVFVAPESFFKSLVPLTSGDEGIVYTCQINGTIYAVKKISLREDYTTRGFILNKMRKVEALSKTPQNRHIVNIYGPVRMENGPTMPRHYLMDFYRYKFQFDDLDVYSPLYNKRIELLIGVCEGMEFSHLNNIYLGDLKIDNIGFDSNNGYSPVILDRDFNALIDPETGDFLGFDFICITMHNILRRYSYKNAKKAIKLGNDLNLLRALDIHAFTIMALRIITGDPIWDSSMSKVTAKNELENLFLLRRITLEEKEMLEAILSDSIEKPSPLLILKPLNERVETFRPFIL